MVQLSDAKRHVVSCGACVYRVRDDVIEVLLVKPNGNKNTWGFPKGHIHENETEHECAVREVLEETGVKVALHERLPECQTTYKHEVKTVKLFYATQVENEVPVQRDKENAEVRWFSIDSLPHVHLYQRSVAAHIVSDLKRRFSASIAQQAHI